MSKELTKAEEQVMQVLWKLEKAFVKDILDNMKSPKPAYNTVSTIIRILQKKEFVGHYSFGKSHQYYPLITKEEYRKQFFKGFLSRYFSGSFNQLVSAFSEEENMSVEDMEELKLLIEKKIKTKKDE
ncbi:MAG: BlaI/MecI/CopY family transcriptional regulator [Bacteroidales bacterium]|jgi:predicted transcriptional regulator|nr:BlaI/MecI/CopY family transcriptional regulator [Bacteroidales bacterium]